MTTETKTQQTDSNRLYALDAISQIAYFSKINVEYVSTILRFLPSGNLKDVMILYREAQNNWLNKIMRSLKGYQMAGVDLYSEMVKDLDGVPIMAMFNIIGNLKQAIDLDGIDEIVEECKGIDDLSPIMVNLKAIIKNEKNKQNAGR